MWNAWGYNTKRRPNHQVVKFLNAIICVPTVSCGYRTAPKNLEVREYKAQTKQILSKIFFFPLSTQMLQSIPLCWRASTLRLSQRCVCKAPWGAMRRSPPTPWCRCFAAYRVDGKLHLAAWYLEQLSTCQQGATGPGEGGRIWLCSLSAVNEEQLMFFFLNVPPAQYSSAKFPSKLWPWALKVLIYSNLIHYAKLGAWLKIENH